MIAGERTMPAATAVDDFMNVRRLTGTIFMVHPPWYFLFASAGHDRGLLIELQGQRLQGGEGEYHSRSGIDQCSGRIGLRPPPFQAFAFPRQDLPDLSLRAQAHVTSR